ncbi:aspartyl-phosphate phosphatase Spo0E family protein [Paenibacillus antarcticus]|uniref:Sporulation protein Spo0E n=1 Tax=Paenibacillus antarcticus TaxID=253703 RepID=A0A168QV13_9BACL|nr:aspartyl-phosphate phosphatase Spo0E family protein [Paenibacillus antarcticus]OAB48247.1 sporulation protein Spo0E [Paenibacillus antarcticus]
MFCADYDMPKYRGGYISEGKIGKWPSKTNESSNREFTLEDEIRMLRSKMEQIFVQEQSFTSEIVIEISSLLDLKINEYMKNILPKK